MLEKKNAPHKFYKKPGSGCLQSEWETTTNRDHDNSCLKKGAVGNARKIPAP